MITAGSMFAGIGGICLAFRQNNCSIVWANEINPSARETYKLNFGNKYLVNKDIKSVDLNTIPYFDILTAGFPCQSFSSAGLQKGFNDSRCNLFFEIIKLIEKIHPKVVFLENVANLANHDNGNTLQIIIKSLSDLNYRGLYQIMNAKIYADIPQQRNRIYIVSFREDVDFSNFIFPHKIPLTKTAFELLDKDKKDSKYYLNNHNKRNMMLKYMTDKNRIYRFTDWGISKGMEGICPTLLASMGSKFDRIPFFFDNYSIRYLTPRECARLQGFPDDFLFPQIDEKQIYKQIGNSVCVPVISRIAKNIIKVLG